MFGLFKSVFELAEDVSSIVVAPVQIAVDVTKAAVEPIADGVREVAQDVKDGLK